MGTQSAGVFRVLPAGAYQRLAVCINGDARVWRYDTATVGRHNDFSTLRCWGRGHSRLSLQQIQEGHLEVSQRLVDVVAEVVASLDDAVTLFGGDNSRQRCTSFRFWDCCE